MVPATHILARMRLARSMGASSAASPRVRHSTPWSQRSKAISSPERSGVAYSGMFRTAIVAFSNPQLPSAKAEVSPCCVSSCSGGADGYPASECRRRRASGLRARCAAHPRSRWCRVSCDSCRIRGGSAARRSGRDAGTPRASLQPHQSGAQRPARHGGDPHGRAPRGPRLTLHDAGAPGRRHLPK